MNSAEAPEDLHKRFVQALNSGDLDALVALYAWDGFLMARGGPARGISAIREVPKPVVSPVNSGLSN